MSKIRKVECTNSLIICYPPESGGKFIGNCLALSDNCYMQDESLMIRQQNGNFAAKDKLQFLLQRLSEVKNTWNDLNLGDDKLDTRPAARRFDLSIELSQGSIHWFQCCHDNNDLQKLSRWWPNHRRIILVNANEFVNYRYGLNKKIDRIIYAHLHQNYVLGNDRPKSNDIKFNVDTFFNLKDFLVEMENLYRSLGFIDFNKDYISQYYNSWMDVIKRLRTVPETITHVHGPQQYLRIQNNLESQS